MTLRSFEKPAGAVPAVFNADSFVSARRGFVYHCIPKTLSRSMLAYLRSVDPEGYCIDERGAGKEVLVARGDAPAPVGFTFVRNPYSRIVAVYYDKFANYADTPGQRAMFAGYEHLHPEMTFDEFVTWLASGEGADRYADPHFLSEHYFVLDEQGNPAVDHVGRMEDADDDMRAIQEILGLPPEPLPMVKSNAMHERAAFDTARRWREVLDDRTTRILTNRYDGDFELFGYERLPYRVLPRFTRGDAQASAPPTLRDRVATRVKRVLARCGVEMRRVPVHRRRGAG